MMFVILLKSRYHDPVIFMLNIKTKIVNFVKIWVPGRKTNIRLGKRLSKYGISLILPKV